jgi:hypothetical protein
VSIICPDPLIAAVTSLLKAVSIAERSPWTVSVAVSRIVYEPLTAPPDRVVPEKEMTSLLMRPAEVVALT